MVNVWRLPADYGRPEKTAREEAHWTACSAFGETLSSTPGDVVFEAPKTLMLLLLRALTKAHFKSRTIQTRLVHVLFPKVYVELVLEDEPAGSYLRQAVFASCIWAFWLAFIASTLGHAPKKVWTHGLGTHHRTPLVVHLWKPQKPCAR